MYLNIHSHTHTHTHTHTYAYIYHALAEVTQGSLKRRRRSSSRGR